MAVVAIIPTDRSPGFLSGFSPSRLSDPRYVNSSFLGLSKRKRLDLLCEFHPLSPASPPRPSVSFSSRTWPSLPHHANVIQAPTSPTTLPRWVAWMPVIQQSRGSDKAGVSGRPASQCPLAVSGCCSAYQCQPAVIMNKTIRGKRVVFLFLTK